MQPSPLTLLKPFWCLDLGFIIRLEFDLSPLPCLIQGRVLIKVINQGDYMVLDARVMTDLGFDLGGFYFGWARFHGLLY